MGDGSKARKNIDSGLDRFQPYSQYKDSGVEWLGEIPSHWSVDRIKQTTSGCQNGVWGDEPNGLHDVVCIRVADFDRTTFRVRIDKPTFRSIDSRIVATRMLSPGELLIEKSGGGERQLVGAVVRFGHDIPAICSNFIARMQISPGYDSRFLCYLHASAYAVRLNLRSIKQSTGIQNLDSEAYLNERASTPPLCEQFAIADFLDRETTKIDALVAKKERLIKLLREKRSALITHAVTKGLDPDAPMKDSGVEWLGEIPAHWEMKRLKHGTTKIGSGKTPTGGAERYVADGAMLLRSQNVHFGGLVLPDVAYIDAATHGEMSSSRVLEDDVLLNITGASLGRCCVARLKGLEANVNQHVCIIRPDQRQLDPAFLANSMESDSLQDQIFNNEDGISRDAVSFFQVGALVLAMPTITEQRTISAYLENETAKIDSLIAKVREAVDRLKELRTALISATVTGKIDVREETV